MLQTPMDGNVIYGYNTYPGGEFAIHWGGSNYIHLESLRHVLTVEGLHNSIIDRFDGLDY